MWCTSPGRGGWRCRAPSATRQRRKTRASPATSSHLPALAAPHEREAIAHELQSTMQELVDLSLTGKQLHWAVGGHAFRPLHEQVDELVASWRDLADVVAERAVALGYVPDGQARAVAAGSPLSPIAAEATASPAAGRAITDRIARVRETARERMDRTAERDAVSQDVLIDVVRTLEHQQWMLRAQLRDGAVCLSYPAASRPRLARAARNAFRAARAVERNRPGHRAVPSALQRAADRRL